MALAPLNFQTPVTAGDALVDKVSVTLGTWVIAAPTPQHHFHIGANGLVPVSAADVEEPAIGNSLDHLVCSLKHHIGKNGLGWIFNAPRDSGQPWSDQQVREDFLPSLPDGAPPLFTGRLVSKKGFGEYRLSADLWINPTRYAQSICARAAVNAPLDNGSRIRKFPKPIVFSGETSFDLQDNWIPVAPGYGGEAEPVTASGRLCEYLANIDSALEEQFLRAATEAGVPFVRYPHYNLTEAELYWEFACPEPLASLEAMRPALRSYSRNVQLREYPNSNIFASTEEIVANCPCWSFPSSTSGILKVYAKTNRRIRIEVSFRVRDVQGVRMQNGGRGELVAQINLLRAQAAMRVNEFFSHMCRAYPTGPLPQTAGDPLRHFLDFVATVRRALQDSPLQGMSAERLSYDILSLLRQHGSIRTPRGSPYAEAIRRLRRKQPPFLIFIGRGVSGTNVIAPEFRGYFDALFSSLTALSQLASVTPSGHSPGSLSNGSPVDPHEVQAPASRNQPSTESALQAPSEGMQEAAGSCGVEVHPEPSLARSVASLGLSRDPEVGRFVSRFQSSSRRTNPTGVDESTEALRGSPPPAHVRE